MNNDDKDPLTELAKLAADCATFRSEIKRLTEENTRLKAELAEAKAYGEARTKELGNILLLLKETEVALEYYASISDKRNPWRAEMARVALFNIRK